MMAALVTVISARGAGPVVAADSDKAACPVIMTRMTSKNKLIRFIEDLLLDVVNEKQPAAG
jgi:hypothetical protein